MGGPLTLEEAGQILLEFKPYVVCEDCKKRTENNQRLLNATCSVCQAWGLVVNPQYAAACARVGISPPEPIHVVKEKELDLMIKKTEETLKRVPRR